MEIATQKPVSGGSHIMDTFHNLSMGWR